MRIKRLKVVKKVNGSEIIYEGYEVPKHSFSGKNILVLKLDNGYNIGICTDKNTRIKVIGEEEISIFKPLQPDQPSNQPKSTKHKFKQPTSKQTKSKPSENEQEDKRLRRAEGWVSILGCGGTIGSKVEYVTGAVYPCVTAQELLEQFPEIKNISKIKTENVISVLSENISPAHWSIIAEKVYEHIKDGAEGVVVTHGTDTMHYSSAALGFMLRNLPVPVIFTGAQRSSDRGSSDTKMNLLSSLVAARSDLAEVALCMHANISDDICDVHRGVNVRKLHTSKRDAFKSVNTLPLAEVEYGSLIFKQLSDYNKRGKYSIKDVKFDNKINDNVALIYIHPGIKPSLIDKLSEYDGVVLAGTGLGHVPTNPFKDKNVKSILDNIKGLVDSNIPVVISSQAIYGRVNLNVYTTGRLLKEINVIGDLCSWTPETAFVKLCWVLGHEKNYDKVKKEMETDIVGEIVQRNFVL